MKAEELRIGNLLWNPVQEIAVRVDLRMLSDIVMRQKDKIDIGLEPILLTEEWLFDFERGVDYWFKGDVILDISPEGLSYRFHYNIIQYVHQLQNLYFALTGKDLQL